MPVPAVVVDVFGPIDIQVHRGVVVVIFVHALQATLWSSRGARRWRWSIYAASTVDGELAAAVVAAVEGRDNPLPDICHCCPSRYS